MYVSVSESFHSCAEDEVLKLVLRLKRCRRPHQKSDVLPMLISWDMFFKNCDLLSRFANDTQTELLSKS